MASNNSGFETLKAYNDEFGRAYELQYGEYRIWIEFRGEEVHEVEARAAEKYLPEIVYFKRDGGLKVQTTAYGHLDGLEIQEVIKGYHRALEVKNAIEERFF